MGDERDTASTGSPGAGRDRLQELTEKRDGAGLSREEADELGRLLAEREGKPYGNADEPPPEVEEERHGGSEQPTP